MTSQTFSGARSVFFIDNGGGPVPVAFAGGVSGEELIDYEPVDVLGLLEVREHVPVAYRTSLNAQIFRVLGDSLKKQGIMPLQDDIITSGDMEALVRDQGVGKRGSATRLTKQTVQLFQGVRCAGHSFDITSRGLVQENVQFVCIRTIDEAETV
jgi:hypothetical protein